MACMAVRSRACERATCCARPRITLRTRMPALSRVLSAFGWAVTARRLPERCVQLEVVNHVSWNDNYGHASGDALLRELAQLLRAAASNPGEIVARNGGDEFCVVFADAEKSSAIERAERLRASIAAADFSGLHAHVFNVKVEDRGASIVRPS